MPSAVFEAGPLLNAYRKLESGEFEEHQIPAVYAHVLTRNQPEWELSVPQDAKIVKIEAITNDP